MSDEAQKSGRRGTMVVMLRGEAADGQFMTANAIRIALPALVSREALINLIAIQAAEEIRRVAAHEALGAFRDLP